MTLDQQIETARTALHDLRTDETEFARLETEKADELATLRAAGSRDFEMLAALEGKRAALASMLVEQRAHVAQARAALERLENRAGRERLLRRAGDIAHDIQIQRAALDANLHLLFDTGLPCLLAILDASQAWATLRQDWQGIKRALGADAPDSEHLDALLTELAARGIPTKMLLLQRTNGRIAPSEQYDTWPVSAQEGASEDLSAQLRLLLQDTAIQALEGPRRPTGGAHILTEQVQVIAAGGYRDPLQPGRVVERQS